MAKFECNLCGKCCQSFGEFIKIERQISENDYFCRYGITNELFQVHVAPEFADAIDEEFSNPGKTDTGTSRKGCPFLRKNPEGKGFVCAVYPTRPSVCREFLCYRMLIHHQPSGELRGRVLGINELKTQDEILAALWMEKIAHIPHPFASQHVAVQHSHSPVAQESHGHDSHLLAHLHGTQHAEDDEWVANVVTILASHGYRAEKVE